jgi:predicted neutral ceramidase superfamily lipid hydrolase
MKYYSPDQGKTEMLFDLEQDPEEADDLSKASVELLNRMRGEFERWQVDCQNSAKSIR